MRATDDPDRILRYAHFPYGFGQKRLRLRGGGVFLRKGGSIVLAIRWEHSPGGGLAVGAEYGAGKTRVTN